MFKKWLNLILMKYITYIHTFSNDQQQFRLKQINEIKDYFIAEIKESESLSKRLSKYIASLDCFNKSLIFLSVATSSISIASFETVIGASVGIVRATVILAFSFLTGIVKKLLKTTRNQKSTK